MKLTIVPAKTGATWVRQGLRTFGKQPLAMSGLFFMFMASMSLLSILPLLGDIAALTLIPAGTLGMMASTREVDAGKFPMPKILLSGFRNGKQKQRNILLLGWLYACGFMSVMGVSALIDGGDLAKLYLMGGSLDVDSLMTSDFRTAMWVALLLYVPLSMMFWHAPALTYWHDVPIVKSLFFSTVACLRNWRAFLVFGLVWSLVFSTTVLVVTLISELLGANGFAVLIFMPLMLLLFTMFFCSLYHTFADCFSLNRRNDTLDAL